MTSAVTAAMIATSRVTSERRGRRLRVDTMILPIPDYGTSVLLFVCRGFGHIEAEDRFDRLGLLLRFL